MSSDKDNPPRGISWGVFFGIMAVLALVVAALILPAIQSGGRNRRRSPLLNNVRSVGLAAANFSSGNEGQLPPLLPGQTWGHSKSKIQRPISFLTSVLPFLERSDIYDSIDASVVWTDPKNHKAYGTRVATFEWPNGVYANVEYSNEKSPAGYAVTYISPNSRIISRAGDPVRIRDISNNDGTTSTIMLGTIDDSRVPAWGDPGNHRDPALGFGGGPYAFGGLEWGAVVVFADGHVSTISKKIDPEVARALASPAGGETITPDDLRPDE